MEFAEENERIRFELQMRDAEADRKRQQNKHTLVKA